MLDSPIVVHYLGLDEQEEEEGEEKEEEVDFS